VSLYVCEKIILDSGRNEADLLIPDTERRRNWIPSGGLGSHDVLVTCKFVSPQNLSAKSSAYTAWQSDIYRAPQRNHYIAEKRVSWTAADQSCMLVSHELWSNVG